MKDRYIRTTIPDGSGINCYFDKNLKKSLIKKIFEDLKNGKTLFDIEKNYNRVKFELKIVDKKKLKVGYFDFVFVPT